MKVKDLDSNPGYAFAIFVLGQIINLGEFQLPNLKNGLLPPNVELIVIYMLNTVFRKLGYKDGLARRALLPLVLCSIAH